MKNFLYSLPLTVGLLLTMHPAQQADALTSNDLVIPDTNGKLTVPQNTQCRAIDFTKDEHRFSVDNDKTTFKGKDSTGNTITNIYDLCIGSFPRFPSTSVEGGIMPYYYLKYRLLPDPMPVYTITTTPLNINNTEIVGVNQKFDIDMAYEAQNKASNNDIYLFYPYDKSHITASPKPARYILGPYQIGYNSYYHNTYRARYFASQVKFDFQVLEPKKNSKVTSEFDNVVYDDKTILFSGTIIYDIPDSCFEDSYLDYKDECREMEFYFPKGIKNKEYTGSRNTDTYTGSVKDTTDTDKNSKNVISKDRTPYMNPGEHNLLVNVTENTQLRVQKDLGTEYQTIGNENNVASNQKPWKGTIAYFGRNDKDITGASISPITTITQIPTHNGKPVQNSGKVITTFVDANYNGNSSYDDWTYNPEKNTNWLNYCDTNTDEWGSTDTTQRIDNGSGGDTNTRPKQKTAKCYHNDGKDAQFWQYKWSKTGWYAENPRPALS